MVLIDALVVLAVMGGIGLAANYWSGRDDRAVRKARNSDIKNLTLRYNVALKGLRAIANGAGNPPLEAQSTLDDIESLHIKELS
jgi:hypothetical protein